MPASNQAMNSISADADARDLALQESALLEKERRYCSYGDTVHYADHPKLMERCEGCYLFDTHGRRYLDLQMWYSAVNLGYANPEVSDAVKSQIDRLPPPAVAAAPI